MRNKAGKAQQSRARTEYIPATTKAAQRKRVKDREQREIALSGGDDPLGQPGEDTPDRYDDEVARKGK